MTVIIFVSLSQMETDLDTKLDWVAANHYDTGQPHTHLVIRDVRDNGKDLVIPRKYISQTLRQRAQDLVKLNLAQSRKLKAESVRHTKLMRSVTPASISRFQTHLIRVSLIFGDQRQRVGSGIGNYR